MVRTVTTLCAILVLGLTHLGCGSSSGRQLGPTSTASPDLVVENYSNNTLHVYVDGGNVGDAPPRGVAEFQILSGTRQVEVRERGHTTRTDLGDFVFGFDVIEVVYRP